MAVLKIRIPDDELACLDVNFQRFSTPYPEVA